MKTVIANSKHMTRDDAIQLLLVIFASLLGLAVAVFFMHWLSPPDGAAGVRPFLLSLALTVVYSGVMGGVIFLLHPRKGWLLARIRDR